MPCQRTSGRFGLFLRELPEDAKPRGTPPLCHAALPFGEFHIERLEERRGPILRRQAEKSEGALNAVANELATPSPP